MQAIFSSTKFTSETEGIYAISVIEGSRKKKFYAREADKSSAYHLSIHSLEKALNLAQNLGKSKTKFIFCDSSILTSAFKGIKLVKKRVDYGSSWAGNWITNGWKTDKNKTVMYAEALKRCLGILEEMLYSKYSVRIFDIDPKDNFMGYLAASDVDISKQLNDYRSKDLSGDEANEEDDYEDDNEDNYEKGEVRSVDEDDDEDE